MRRRTLLAAVLVVSLGAGVVAVGAVRSDGGGTSPSDGGPAPDAVGPVGDDEGAAAPTTAPAVEVDHRLFAVGDSVLQGAADELVDALDDWEVTVDTRVGRFLDEGIRVVRRHRRDLADVALVVLGNNYGGDRASFAVQVEEMLEGLGAVDHVFWLTVAEFRADRRQVNSVLRAAAARDHRVRLIDWNAVWADDPALTAADRLHLTPAGAERMAQLVARELRSAGMRPRPGAGRSQVVTAGTIPSGAAGAAGAVGATPARRPTTTSSVASTVASTAPGAASSTVPDTVESTTTTTAPEPLAPPSTEAPTPPAEVGGAS